MEYEEFDRLSTKLRKIYGIDDLHNFLCPTEKELHSPYLLKNIEKAKDIITDAIQYKNRITIFGDCDNDGQAGLFILFSNLSRFTDKITYVSPQRSVGHGLNLSLDLIPRDTELLIIVDSSSNDFEGCYELHKRGIDIVILDHHQISKQNNYCTLVNPQQEDCIYPNKEVSGATLAWKMSQVLDEFYGTNYAKDYIDVCAIGMQGDMMSMSKDHMENRYILFNGLRNIHNIGIKALIKQLKLNIDKLSASDISFYLSPALNACCRLDVIEKVMDILCETNEDKALEKAKVIVALNDERKKTQTKYVDQYKPMISNDKCSIIIDNTIGKGYRGLLANDLSNTFQKPIMVLSEDNNGLLTGSFRSYAGLDLKELLNGIPEVEYAEGHNEAGGTGFNKKDLTKVQEYLNRHLQIDTDEQSIEYVLEFNCEDLDEFVTRTVQDFYLISGKDFETGNFLIRNVCPLDCIPMGKDKKTLKAPVYPASQTWFYDKHDYTKLTSSVSLMKFRTNPDEYFPEELVGQEIIALGSLNWNEFFNPRTRVTTRSAQVYLEDYRVVN